MKFSETILLTRRALVKLRLPVDLRSYSQCKERLTKLDSIVSSKQDLPRPHPVLNQVKSKLLLPNSQLERKLLQLRLAKSDSPPNHAFT